MPDTIVTAGPSPATAATQTPTTPTTSADVANANALNQAVSAVRLAAAATNAAVIAKVNAIASAIPTSMIGGTTGNLDSHLLLSKGTTGFAIKPSATLTQGGAGELQISNTTAGSLTEVLRLKPTDWTTGKPYLAFKTGGAIFGWQLVFWDGTNTSGQLDILCTNSNIDVFANNNKFGGFSVSAPDGHTVRVTSSLNASDWIPNVQAGDNAITYNINGANNTGNLVVGPTSAFSAGFRMDNNGITSFRTEVGFQGTALTDAATIAWDCNQNQCTLVQIAGNRTMGTPTNMQSGFSYVLVVQQDATGGRTLSFPNPPFKFPGGVAPVLSTAAGAVDIFTFYAVNSVNFMAGVLQKNFT